MPIFTLMTVPFVFTLGGFVFAGLLDPMATALGVSVARVATLQAAFAFACAFAGPVLAHVTRNRSKKPLLIATLVLLACINGWSALAEDFDSLMLSRIMIGGLGALALPLAVSIGVAMAPPERRARTIAGIYAGVAFALMLGVPAGSVIGGVLGWRASFWMTAALCIVSLVLVASRVPKVPVAIAPTGGGRLDAQSFGYLAVTLLAFSAMFAMVGFIGPVITALTGFGAYGIAALQVLIGVSCLAGLRFGAGLAARPAVPGLPILFGGIVLALAVVIHPLSLGAASAYGLMAMIISILVAPASQFGTAPIVQTRLAQAAGPSATFALALNGSMVYLGQGLGVASGAYAIGRWGLVAAPITGVLIAMFGMGLALGLRRLTANGKAEPAQA